MLEGTLKIYTKNNVAEYDLLLKNYELKLDIYYTSEFLLVDAEMQNGDFEIFTIIENQNIFIYPYLKLSLSNYGLPEYYDLTSPYGFCGPYCTDKVFFESSEKQFVKYAAKNKFVTEFVRYHYNFNKKLQFTQQITNSFNRSMFVLNLQNPWDYIWMKEMSSTNRNIVRKLQNDNFQFEVHYDTKWLNEFIEMYRLTMQNVSADRFYYFRNDFYKNLFDNLKEKIVIARVTKDNITYCSALFLINGDFLTYYLSSRNLEFHNIPATNLMLANIIKYGKEIDIKYFNIGGGRTIAKDDSLFKFKSNFCKASTDFYIGKRVHLPEAYEQLKTNFITIYGQDKYESIKHILQFYRL